MFKKKMNTRIFPRLRLYNFIKYKLESEPDAKFAIANVGNISASGILFICKKELPKGEMLNISINFPGIEPIDTKAQVVRASRTDNGEYETGAHFITINESTKQELVKRIDFILEKIAARKSLLGQFKRIIKRK